MAYNSIQQYLSHYDDGTIASLELLQLFFSHITAYPQEAAQVLAALQAHQEPEIQHLATDIIELLNGRVERRTSPDDHADSKEEDGNKCLREGASRRQTG